jgi:uncharacterized OsmC-like protein
MIPPEVDMPSSDIRSALERLSLKIAAQPEKAEAKYAPATATIGQGLKCRVTGPSGEHVETDMPPAMGGMGSCPNPGWYFRASMAACCATVIAMRAARLGIDLSKLEVTVESEGDHRGILGLDDKVSAGAFSLRTNVRIGSDNATPGQLEELVRWADQHSPVGCTVQNAPPNTLSIQVV